MGTINKLKSNFINRNSFNVGFNNRSPLNQYKSAMPTSFDLPKLDGAKVGKHIADGAQAISNAKLKSGEAINQSIMGAAKEIGTAIGKKQAAKKANEEKEKQEKEKEKEKQEKANIERSKIIHGLEDDSLAQQILAPHLVGVNEEARNEKKRNELTGQINKALNL